MMRSPWAVLKQRDFALIWGASLGSDLGTWMQISALGIFVTQMTGDSRLTGIASTVSYLGGAMLLPIGGIFADRFDRRKLAIAASIVEMCIAGIMAVAFHEGMNRPLILIILTGILGMAGALRDPSIAAMLPDVVTKDHVAQAAFLQDASWNAGRALGPIVAVAVIAVADYDAVFFVNALTYLAVALSLAFVNLRVRHKPDVISRNVYKSLCQGLYELRHNTICRNATMLGLFELSILAPFIALIPAMGQLTLDGGARATAALFFCQGIGSAVGLMMISIFIHRIGYGKSVAILFVVLWPLLCVYALSQNLTMAAIAILPLSAVHSSTIALCTSFLQRFARDDVRARVLGINMSFIWLGYACVASALGPIADYIGLRSTLLGLAALGIGASAIFAFGKHNTFSSLIATDAQQSKGVFR